MPFFPNYSPSTTFSKSNRSCVGLMEWPKDVSETLAARAQTPPILVWRLNISSLEWEFGGLWKPFAFEDLRISQRVTSAFPYAGLSRRICYTCRQQSCCVCVLNVFYSSSVGWSLLRRPGRRDASSWYHGQGTRT